MSGVTGRHRGGGGDGASVGRGGGGGGGGSSSNPKKGASEAIAGVLWTAKTTAGGGAVGAFKRRFWVVDHAERRLECFGSDMEMVPKYTVPATGISSVAALHTKHNKFFDFKVTLIHGRDIYLRAESRDERARWLAAVTSLLEASRNPNRVSAFVLAVQQRLVSHSERLDVELTVDFSSVDAVPEALFHAFLEAIDAGAALVAEIRERLPADMDSPIASVLLSVLSRGGHNDANHSDEDAAALVADHLSRTSYSPAQRKLLLQLVISNAPDGSVYVQHEDSSGIIDIISSTVWRDPAVEGWIASDPECEAARRKVAHLLGRDDEAFAVGFKWGQDMHLIPEERRRAYLRKHVSGALMAEVVEAFQEACGATDQRVLLPASGDDTGLLIDVEPWRVMREMVTGVTIHLAGADVEADAPPPLSVEHCMSREPRLAVAMVALSQLRSLRRAAPDHSLARQLRDITLQVRIAAACKLSEVRAAKATRCRDGCAVDWPSVIAVVGTDVPDLAESDIPVILEAIGQAYAQRWKETVAELQAGGALETFRRCVGSTSLVVVSDRSAANTPRPTGAVLNRGVFSETVALAVDAPRNPPHTRGRLVPLSLHAPHQRTEDDEAGPQAGAPHPLDGPLPLALVFTVPQLDIWLSGYFSHVDNVVDAPPRDAADGASPAADGDDDDADAESIVGSEDAYFAEQETVAVVRSREARALTLHDVVNIVYDSQEAAPAAMKVSTSVIRQSIAVLDQRLPQRVAKQDLSRMLSTVLFRLRAAFDAEATSPPPDSNTAAQGAAVDPAATTSGAVTAASLPAGFLPVSRAKAMLRALCEYASTEERIGHALHGGHRATALASCSFQRAAEVMLNVVVPDETLLALRSRRDVLVLGLEGVGKSTVISNIRREAPRPLSTIGVTQTVAAFEEWTLLLRELGGRSDFRSNWTQYLRLIGPVSAVIAVVDTQKPDDYAEFGAFVKAVLAHKHFRSVPVLFILNHFSPPQQRTATTSQSSPTQAQPPSLPPVHSAMIASPRGVGTSGGRRSGGRRQRHAPTSVAQIVRRLRLADIVGSGRPYLYIGCCVTHMSAVGTVDENLDVGLRWLCRELATATPPSELPQKPKS